MLKPNECDKCGGLRFCLNDDNEWQCFTCNKIFYVQVEPMKPKKRGRKDKAKKARYISDAAYCLSAPRAYSEPAQPEPKIENQEVESSIEVAAETISQEMTEKHIEKEVIMQVEPTAEGAVPPKPRKRKLLKQYYEDNKVAVIADYQAMELREFLKKWRLSTANWATLKREWEVPGKARGGKTPKTRPEKKDRLDDRQQTGKQSPQDITEHEHYLMLLGYRHAIREILGIE